VCSLVIGFLVFLAASKRYVKRPPEKTVLFRTLKLIGKSVVFCKPFQESKTSNGGELSDNFVDGVTRLLQVIPVAMLVLPFTIVYSQISTVFIIQGEAMKKMGLLDASVIANFDPIFVLLMGLVVSSFLYPALSKKGIHIPITYKFAIGTVFAACGILWTILVDRMIHSTYFDSGSQVPIMWQILSYAFVGAGEIFAMATSYEMAFKIAPQDQKGLASALQLVSTLGIASYTCVGLYNACSHWFPSGSSDTSENLTEDYANSKLENYLWLLFGIAIFGILINIFPPVKKWVEGLRARGGQEIVISNSSEEDYTIKASSSVAALEEAFSTWNGEDFPSYASSESIHSLNP
jgi:dipeptide/tripeptide permease